LPSFLSSPLHFVLSHLPMPLSHAIIMCSLDASHHFSWLRPASDASLTLCHSPARLGHDCHQYFPPIDLTELGVGPILS
jgi:hypothetical protein